MRNVSEDPRVCSQQSSGPLLKNPFKKEPRSYKDYDWQQK